MRFLTEKCDSLPFCFSHTISSYTTSGGGKKGVAIRPYPSPGPLPFIPNAFYMCEALSGFDSCWAALRKKEIKLGIEFFLAKM